MAENVAAYPSKAFFVSMLTRDIELKDAILDLLDNCVDGIMRQLPTDVLENSPTPYTGFWARINASPEFFSIKDNCGGIPKEVAKESAFRLGRADLKRDQDIPTVGMYGIGMKRALFKLGRHSEVCSQHERDQYCVTIPPEWLDDDNDWNLDMVDAEDRMDENGTRIVVTELHPSIARQLDPDKHRFLSELRAEVSNLFALIIKKGFTVYLNNARIEPANLDILVPSDFNQRTIKPYAYKATIDDVDIELVVGFYRELASQIEIDMETEDEQHIPRRTSDNAGWTVICNDRVVLSRDKTPITGWGVRDIPKYHNQFIAIAGVVQFSSNNSLQLPLNTTKRGLDTSSFIYWHTLDYMMDGLKMFTSFTNKWKGRETETNDDFSKLTLRSATEIADFIPLESWSKVRRGHDSELRFIPDLPTPPTEKTTRRVSFVRLKEEIELLGDFFFENPQASPAEVGNRCFDRALEEVKKEYER